MDVLADRLSSARQAAGLLQRELAQRAGLDQSHLARVESGDRGLSSDALREVAKALRVSVTYLMGEDTPAITPWQQALLDDSQTPVGLRALAEDTPLVNAMSITESELRQLRSIELTDNVTKDGYVHLLFTLRVIQGT